MSASRQHKSFKRTGAWVVAAACWAICLGIITGGVAFSPRAASAQSSTSASRVIQGKVYAATGEILSEAVVYLKDMKTLEIKTYISTRDGSYRFGQLGTQDDYQLWAEAGGRKSKVKTISSFDSKKFFEVPLHIEAK